MTWSVYILECGDKTLYTGISNDVSGRIEKHEQGTGAKYTKGRGPFRLGYVEACENRAAASRREREIKTMSRADKLKLMKAQKQR